MEWVVSMEIKLFSTVRLKDGRVGDVVDIYESPLGYEIDFSGHGEFENITEGASPDMIAEVIFQTAD